MLRPSCPSREELLAFAIGEISVDALVDLAEHLDVCSGCQSTLSQLHVDDDSLIHLVAQAAREPVSWISPAHEEACRKGIEQFLALGHDASRAAGDGEETGLSLEAPPKTIGQYEIIEEIGRGGMGIVYKARHLSLHKFVALKLLSASRLGKPGSVDRFQREMRSVGELEHPNIVRATDAGEADGLHYLAMELIEGRSLSDRIKSAEGFSIEDACVLIRQIATGLQHAHEHGIVHRDLKPSNILLDSDGTARIADFGLAAKEAVPDSLAFAGTPGYMSPEQARGEGHRVDRRSDIFSLGTLFYQLLVGRRPFSGATTQELCDQITSADPVPPRACDESIPNEIERICLKALAKHASQRYATAGQIADELGQWLERHEHATGRMNGSPVSSGNIVPKGLRHYDAADADFFLALLPGPKDRDGLPESLRFWKSRIEETNGDRAFGVGVLCGPSGSGKSSLVHAGLLPRLAKHVTALRVVATGDHTESVLSEQLRELAPELPKDAPLPELIAGLRRKLAESGDRKILIVLDQFEQWFHGNPEVEGTRLADALRQCDGCRVQALLIVRDDFWLATTRFMQALDIPLAEGKNSAVVDQFDRRHARSVLCALGTAFGVLPSQENQLTSEQRLFLTHAVSELADDGRVSPIRLVLFSEMIKDSPWELATLQSLGGVHGMGVTFLDHTFSSRSPYARYRQHEQSARAILSELSVGRASQIRERSSSKAQLLHVSGYEGRPTDFDEIVDILDRQLKLITPIDSANRSIDGEGQTATPDAECYQLTHDFLIPAVREWSALKQKETARGRAELQLRECAALWSERQESRYLPSLWEWTGIRLASSRHTWSDSERRMMRRAGRRYSLRLGIMAMLLVAVSLAASHFRREMTWNRSRALTEELVRSSTDNVDATIAKILSAHESVQYHLRQRYHSESTEHGRLRCAIGLAHLGQVEQSCLIGWLRRDQRSEFENILAALANADRQVCDRILTELEDEPDPHIRARLAMTMMRLEDPSGVGLCLKLASDPVYRTTFIDDLSTYDAWPGSLHTVLTTTKDAAFRSGLCEALGTVSHKRFPDRQFQQLRESLLRLHSVASDGATHSAAAWALRRWDVAIPELDRTRDPLLGRDWFTNQHDVTMIRIPAGSFTMGRQIPSYFETKPPSPPADAIPHEVTLTSGFWVSACEVTHGLYQQFLNDETLDERERPPGNQPNSPLRSSHESHPANCVSWFDALLFCNWLSIREGRSPCYHRTGAVQPADHMQEAWEVWECDFGSDGYRLLTEAEWEYACKAMSETAFSFGGFTERLSDFAVFRAESVDYVETRRPNGWGLFDMHGNVSEWCWDPRPAPSEKPEIDPHGVSISRYRPIRGGNWRFQNSAQFRSAECLVHDNLNYRDANIGFRLALSEPSTPDLADDQGDTPPTTTDPSAHGDPSHTHRPPPPSILGWNDEFRFEEDNVFAREWLTVFGKASPGTIVELLNAVTGTTLAQGIVPDDGTWTLRVADSAEKRGHYVATARDYSNHVSFPSKILSFDNDRSGSLSWDAEFVTRPVIDGWDILDETVDAELIGGITFRGTASPNAQVILWDYAHAQRIVETQTSPEGRWQLSTGPLTPGKWHFVARAYSNVGVSAASELLSLIVDESGGARE